MDDLISMGLTEKQAVKELMIKYGFTAPDMTVTEFVEDVLPSAQPEPSRLHWTLPRLSKMSRI